MALTTQITARLVPSIGLVGQTSGFVDFTKLQLESNGFISTLTRQFKIDAAATLGSITDPLLGMAALLTQLETDVDAYLQTVFTDSAVTYLAKIYVTNVIRKSDPITGVITKDALSVYVDREDMFYTDVRINVSVV